LTALRSCTRPQTSVKIGVMAKEEAKMRTWPMPRPGRRLPHSPRKRSDPP
jgi:hypothetical protein